MKAVRLSSQSEDLRLDEYKLIVLHLRFQGFRLTRLTIVYV